MHVIEKERYNRKVDAVKFMEDRLQKQVELDQQHYDQLEAESEAKVLQLSKQLEEDRSVTLLVDGLKKENEERAEEIMRMQDSLAQAKACTLHEAVGAAAVASKTQADKLHRIIAHLQKELLVSNNMAEELQAEQNILKEELAKAGRKNDVLEMSLEASKFDTENSSPLALFARKIAAVTKDDGQVMRSLKATMAELQAQVAAEQSKARALEGSGDSETSSHEAAKRAMNEKLGKETKALLHYAHDLEQKLKEKQERAAAQQNGDSAPPAPPAQLA